MGYSFALISLASLTNKEFQTISPCDKSVITKHEMQKIASKEQSWLYDLCKDISPSQDDSRATKRPWPRYIPVRTIERGGMALLIEIYNQWEDRNEILKLPLPKCEHDNKQINEKVVTAQPQKNPTKANVVRGTKEIISMAKDFIYRKLEPPKKKQPEIISKSKEEIARELEERKKLEESSAIKRFHREYIVQQQSHRRANKSDPNRMYGYVPQPYIFSFPPKMFFTMELIRGQKYVEYIQTHSDEENFQLFLKVVIFIEIVLHNLEIAHADLKAENILVANGTPILLDYGVIKAKTLENITIPGAQFGNPGYAPAEQLQDSLTRGLHSDIFALGRLLWVTINRKEPDISVVPGRFEDERLVMDEETEKAIGSLFIPYVFQDDRLLKIFEKNQSMEYQNISEFRADLESIYFIEEKKTIICEQPCEALLDLYKVVEKLVEREIP